MLNTEQIPLGVNRLGEDKVEIEEGWGETTILDLEAAKQRLNNLLREQERDGFAGRAAWQKQIDASKRAIALLEQVDNNRKKTLGSKINKAFRKVRSALMK